MNFPVQSVTHFSLSLEKDAVGREIHLSKQLSEREFTRAVA